MGSVICVNGRLIEAFVIELLGGLRVRFAIDDWNALDLFRGQRVPVKLTGKDEVCLYLSEALEAPPIAWAVFVARFRQ
jgi:hypothetical protein